MTDVSASRFRPGQVVATPGAMEALRESGETASSYIKRHLEGDWGTVDVHDRAANELALIHGARLLSAYVLRSGTRIWVITEADRSSTCVLLPDEY